MNNQEIISALEKIIEALKKPEETSQIWTPVSERLPEKDMSCWVTAEYNGMRGVISTNYSSKKGFNIGTLQAIAWVPSEALEPYEGER